MQRHAYLIMAHNEPKLLYTLVSMLDDYRNDIYIHIDKKSNLSVNFRTVKSKLIILKEISVVWGTTKQIETELLLYKTANKNYKYDYYHLLSGVDLPLKSQNYLHSFFSNNKGKEFINIDITDYNTKDIFWKTNYYWICVGRFKSPIKYFIFGCIRKSCIFIQKLFHVHRKYKIPLYKGANWCSLTNECVEFLLAESKTILKTFKFTSCADEMYKQTWIMNSSFKNRLYLTVGGGFVKLTGKEEIHIYGKKQTCLIY